MPKTVKNTVSFSYLRIAMPVGRPGTGETTKPDSCSDVGGHPQQLTDVHQIDGHLVFGGRLVAQPFLSNAGVPAPRPVASTTRSARIL